MGKPQKYTNIKIFHKVGGQTDEILIIKIEKKTYTGLASKSQISET